MKHTFTKIIIIILNNKCTLTTTINKIIAIFLFFLNINLQGEREEVLIHTANIIYLMNVTVQAVIF